MMGILIILIVIGLIGTGFFIDYVIQDGKQWRERQVREAEIQSIYLKEWANHFTLGSIEEWVEAGDWYAS